MIKRSALVFFITTVFFLSFIVYSTAADEDSRFTTALKLVEMTFNKDAVYQQFMYFGILPAKERYENNPKTKEYSEILVGLIREVMTVYFNDPETQKKLKSIYAAVYSEGVIVISGVQGERRMAYPVD